MKGKKIVIQIYLLLLIVYISKVTVLADSIEDISGSILKKTNGSIIESGLRYELTISGNPEESFKEIFDLLSINKEDVEVSDGEGSKREIAFHNSNVKGFIAYSQENSKIIVELVEEGHLENIASKKNKMDEFLKRKVWKVVRYEYLKAISPEKNISNLKAEIEYVLKAFDANNISSVHIEKGYSITGYIGIGNSMKNGNHLIDINCAVRSCESGSYIIIGTPVISTSY
ncbi:MAG: hypothetical protein GX895_00595 [Clostridiales bacterium]|uniref:YwmB family TATA-box binding protein n=1 Tax=Clostridium sp. N3C TaxID=1776758 RepID=UPI00092E0A1A|nr:YwmB family TATA-box binding protein [Clostridium sp. N3C]NLZ47281.1 hypothetical protein [Clostridiales bacterium]SCN23921.1 hypothetical protein N3C_1560 [Clostridium sp. N3C]